MGYGEALSRTSKQAFAPFPALLRRGIGWVAWIAYSDKGFVQGEKNTGGRGRKGSFQVK